VAGLRARPQRSRAAAAGHGHRRRRAGIWKATRELWPAATEQRCTVHALGNITTKLPERLHREVKARYWAFLDGAASASDAKAGLVASASDYRRAYPSAMRVIDEHVDQLVAHLRFPLEHRKRTRSTNLLERTFVEVRRRTKIIGRFPGETGALSLIWAVLELASRGWRGITMTPEGRRRDRAPPPRPRARRHPALDRGGGRRLRSLTAELARASFPGTWDATMRTDRQV
jgi:putative transposase